MADEEFKATNVLFGEDAVDRVKKRHDVKDVKRGETASSEGWCPKVKPDRESRISRF